MTRALALTAGFLAGVAPALAGQSLFSTRGLGSPVAPIDARARALGGIGVGLFGLNPGLVNPAAPAGLQRRGVTATLQPVSRTIEFADRREGVSSTRFPLIQVTYPVGTVVPHVGAGGFLDQSWALAVPGTAVVGQDTLRVLDRIEASGGIAQVQAGIAVPVTPSLAVGAAVGRYTGGVDRVVARHFVDVPPDEVRDFETRTSWTYGAPLASFGVRWDPAPVLRLAGALTWAGRLSVDGGEDLAAAFPADLPLQLTAGASALLASDLAAVAGVRWAGWSAAADDLVHGALDTWQVGGGLEWEGARLADRILPIRFGGSYGRLPFPLTPNGEAPTEWAVGLGAGIHLVSDDAGPAAVADFTLERGGSRAEAIAGALNERFWRFTVGVSVHGR